MINGPMVIGIVGPIRSDTDPASGDSSSMHAVKGSSAKPARMGDSWATTWSATTSHETIPLSAAYTRKVTRFVALKARDRKTSSGSIGIAALASRATSAIRPTTPISVIASDPTVSP